jgi:hypothetical protein
MLHASADQPPPIKARRGADHTELTADGHLSDTLAQCSRHDRMANGEYSEHSSIVSLESRPHIRLKFRPPSRRDSDDTDAIRPAKKRHALCGLLILHECSTGLSCPQVLTQYGRDYRGPGSIYAILTAGTTGLLGAIRPQGSRLNHTCRVPAGARGAWRTASRWFQVGDPHLSPATASRMCSVGHKLAPSLLDCHWKRD